ncbi:MAG: hypothetical protein AABO57_08515 [Acidobacteriota bacterium]
MEKLRFVVVQPGLLRVGGTVANSTIIVTIAANIRGKTTARFN